MERRKTQKYADKRCGFFSVEHAMGTRQIIGWLIDTPRREAVLAAVLAFVLFFAGTADIPVMGRDEARFAQAAREMLAASELVVPTFGGVDRYHKPILIYWCTMACYAVFGVTVRAARLPSNLTGAMAVLLLAWIARRRFGPGAGLLAGMLLTATLTFHVQARGCTADMVMLLPTLAVMLIFERLLDGSGGVGHAVVFWVAMGLAVLAKGPIAPAWVVMTALALWVMGIPWRRWQAWVAGVLLVLGWWFLGPTALVVPLAVGGWQLVRSEEGRQALGRLRPGWGILLLLAVVLPWGVAAVIETRGAFLVEGVGHHVVGRSLTAFESHGGFPGFYLVTGLIAAFPWFPFLASATVPRRRWRPEDQQWRFLVAWLVGPLVLLELVQTKLVHYWMPSYPAGVLLVVGWLLTSRTAPTRPERASQVLLVLGGLLTAAVPVALPLAVDVESAVPAGVAAAALLLLGVTLAMAWWRRRPVAAVVAVAVGCSLYLVVLACGSLPILGNELLGPRAGQRAVGLRDADEAIVVFRARDDELFFYLPIGVENCRATECLERWIVSGRPFLGIGREDDVGRFRDDHPSSGVRIVDLVEGVDLVRARRSRIVLFRPSVGTPDR
jgi:4-amino-4-deoxy-L-arabinose transferase-like glycosyltransferase